MVTTTTNLRKKLLNAIGENVTFKRAFATIALGIILVCISSFNAGVKSISDLASTFVKHPIMALVFIGAFFYSFYAMAKAREERDTLNKQAYIYEQQIDSLKLYINK